MSVEYKFACLLSTGWLGRSGLHGYRIDDDGRGPDYVMTFIELLRSKGVLVTSDKHEVHQSNLPAFELHIESQLSRLKGVPRYLLLLEEKHIRPQNFFISKKKYRKIFTWNDDLVQELNAIKFTFPAYINPGPINDFEERDIFLSMISANKGQAISTPHDLYKKRREIIRWYQRNAPEDFRLYGPDWNLPYHPDGILAKILFKLLKKSRMFSGGTRKLWHGIAPNKHQVLLKSKFNLCFENYKGARGYISEKIFDSFSAGCVPIYWGAPNIKDVIPEGCFIDFANFNSVAEMHHYISTISQERYLMYQREILSFCKDRKDFFGLKNFSETIASNILIDIN